MSYELLLARRRILMASKRVWPTLLYISEAEVSMLCVDGSDGKGGYIDLTAISSDGGSMGPLTWSSSNAAVATVTPISLTKARVTAVSGAALGSTITISCTQGAIVKTCSVTVFSTMPTINDLYAIKEERSGLTAIDTNYVVFSSSSNAGGQRAARLCTKLVIPTSGGIGYLSESKTSANGAVNGGFYPLYNSYEKKVAYSEFANNVGSIGNYTTWWFGPVMIGGTTQTMDVSRSIQGCDYNGVIYTPSSTYYDTFTPVSRSQLAWKTCTIKTCLASYGSSTITKTDLFSRNHATLLYIPQNYIRYTDHDSYVNYTVIPNIGTLGHEFDLSANNVPSLWFGV